MHMNKLGQTGLFVSELCLGAMTFGGTEEPYSKMGSLDQAQADQFIARALEAGINIIDTADAYSGGVSEQITGQALKNLGTPRDSILIATKGHAPTGQAATARGLSRLHLMDAVKASLTRLQLDHIDLYQVHGFDPATPIEETLRALETIVQHGHARYIGVSNWAAWQIMKAQGIAARQNLTPIASLQAYYSIARRDLEREITPMLRSEGLGLMVWSPLAGGLLSGKYGREQDGHDGRRAAFDFPPVEKDRALNVIDVMRPMAERRRVSVAQIALAWLLRQKPVSTVIIGAKRMDQLEDNLAATSVELTEQDLDTLDQVSALPREYPGWMFERQSARAKQLAESGRKDAR